MPMKTWLAMRVLTSLAKAPMMLPMRAMPLPMIKNLGDGCQPNNKVISVNWILPSPSEDIRQLTNHEENNSAEHDVCKGYPEDVG